MKIFKTNRAFTLAEVLITLAIIGVVAAITIPTVVRNYRATIIKTQFKKVYSTLQNGWTKAQVDMGYKPECFYWVKNPYGGGATCISRSEETGLCTKYEMPDGSNLPSDYNGLFGECAKFKNQLLGSLGVAKTCKTNAYAGGCIPEYEGGDSLYQTANPEATQYDIGVHNGCTGWYKNNILNTREAWVLRDGTIILFYSGGPHIFAVDINGMKKPNKWGHDIFEFRTAGDKNSHLRIIPGGCMPVESGGSSTTTMLKNTMTK